MINIDSYTVYDNETNLIIANGTWAEIEEYLDEDSHSIDGFTVVWDINGYEL